MRGNCCSQRPYFCCHLLTFVACRRRSSRVAQSPTAGDSLPVAATPATVAGKRCVRVAVRVLGRAGAAFARAMHVATYCGCIVWLYALQAPWRAHDTTWCCCWHRWVGLSAWHHRGDPVREVCVPACYLRMVVSQRVYRCGLTICLCTLRFQALARP